MKPHCPFAVTKSFLRIPIVRESLWRKRDINIYVAIKSCPKPDKRHDWLCYATGKNERLFHKENILYYIEII